MPIKTNSLLSYHLCVIVTISLTFNYITNNYLGADNTIRPTNTTYELKNIRKTSSYSCS